MAKLRYERSQAEAQQQEDIRQHELQLEQSMGAADTSPVMSAEPYMASGYEMMAKREYEESARREKSLKQTQYSQATDPVYNQTDKYGGGLWEKNVGSVMDMANNYGAFAYARENSFQSMYADEEMVM